MAINAILPMFFELAATIYCTSRRQERRDAVERLESFAPAPKPRAFRKGARKLSLKMAPG